MAIPTALSNQATAEDDVPAAAHANLSGATYSRGSQDQQRRSNPACICHTSTGSQDAHLPTTCLFTALAAVLYSAKACSSSGARC